MKLKRPKITDGTWRLNEESNQVFGGIECIASGPPLPLLDHERANFTAIAALPEVMDALEKIHFATGCWDYEDLRPEGTKMLHSWSTDALLKMGYTVEEGETVTRAPSRKTGEHLFVPAGGFPICATCGCDEDDAFVGGQECTYQEGDES